jgi:hypothetical protein
VVYVNATGYVKFVGVEDADVYKYVPRVYGQASEGSVLQGADGNEPEVRQSTGSDEGVGC